MLQLHVSFQENLLTDLLAQQVHCIGMNFLIVFVKLGILMCLRKRCKTYL